MSYTGPENNLTHTPGYERIPDNWYKRNPSDEYSIPYCMFALSPTQKSLMIPQ
jgi:hypothetical protein